MKRILTFIAAIFCLAFVVGCSKNGPYENFPKADPYTRQYGKVTYMTNRSYCTSKRIHMESVIIGFIRMMITYSQSISTIVLTEICSI